MHFSKENIWWNEKFVVILHAFSALMHEYVRIHEGAE